MSCDQKVMMLLPLMEKCSMDFGQVKIDSTCAFLLTLDRFLLYLCIFNDFGQVFTKFGQDIRLWKTTQIPSLWQKFKNHVQDLAQVTFNDSINRNQELGFPVNKQTSKVQSFISFCDTFFWFVQRNKIYMIRKNKDTKSFT